MRTRPRRVLVVQTADSPAAGLVDLLRRRSHDVSVAYGAEQALELPAPEVLVTDVDLPGTSGLDLLAELRRRGRRDRAVVLSRTPDVDACRRALRLQAADFLVEPFPLAELLLAVEGEPAQRAADRPGRWQRTLPATPDSIDRAAREVAAHALRCSLSPAARARVASVCAELVENVVRHAYPNGTGSVHLELEVDRRRLVLAIRDEGVGFDVAAAGLEHLRASTDGGFARASALSEDLRVESDGSGTTATASFDVFRVLFDEQGQLDLSELDWLVPETARSVLELLSQREREPALVLSPALAVTIGRLLAGPDTRRVLQTALWSA